MTMHDFPGLLQAARTQAEPQRLLFVFATVGISADCTPAQRAAFEAGEGGELTPVMCVDKDPAELRDFAALAAEADATGQDWALVFVGAMCRSRQDDAAQVDAALRGMVEAIATGAPGPWVPFDRAGRPVQLG